MENIGFVEPPGNCHGWGFWASPPEEVERVTLEGDGEVPSTIQYVEFVPGTGEGWDDATNLETSALAPTGDPGDWEVTFEADDLGDINGCAPDCGFASAVAIPDDGTTSCAAFNDVEVCLFFGEGSTEEDGGDEETEDTGAEEEQEPDEEVDEQANGDTGAQQDSAPTSSNGKSSAKMVGATAATRPGRRSKGGPRTWQAGQSAAGAARQDWASPRAGAGGDVDVRPARCREGTGTFALYPTSVSWDTSGQRAHKALFRPVQIDGSGSLTAEAAIEDIRVLNGELPITLVENRLSSRIIGEQERFDAAAVKHVLAIGGGRLSLETLTGDVFFLMEDIDRQLALDHRIEMSWTCPAGEARPDARAGGYTFTPSEIGCPVDWPQEFILRPVRWSSAMPDLSVELNGVSRAGKWLQTKRVGSLVEVVYDIGAVEFQAAIERVDEEALVLRLEKLAWNGLPICAPGIYRIPAAGWRPGGLQ